MGPMNLCLFVRSRSNWHCTDASITHLGHDKAAIRLTPSPVPPAGHAEKPPVSPTGGFPFVSERPYPTPSCSPKVASELGEITVQTGPIGTVHSRSAPRCDPPRRAVVSRWANDSVRH